MITYTLNIFQSHSFVMTVNIDILNNSITIPANTTKFISEQNDLVYFPYVQSLNINTVQNLNSQGKNEQRICDKPIYWFFSFFTFYFYLIIKTTQKLYFIALR